MHIIFTPLPFLFFIVSQGNMAAVHGRTRAHSVFFCPAPSLASSPSRPLASPPVLPGGGVPCWRGGGGGVRVQPPACLPAEAPTGCCWSREGAAAPLCVALFMAVGRGVRYIEPVVWSCSPPQPLPPLPPRTDHPGQPECKTTFSGLVFERLLGCTLP